MKIESNIVRLWMLLSICTLNYWGPGLDAQEMDSDGHEHLAMDVTESLDDATHTQTEEHGHTGFHRRPDSHAPAGLAADHAHKKGNWMAEYKLMYMNMQSMRQGTTQVTAQQAIAGAGVAASPTDMNMAMHMGHVMYGLNDCVTLYTMFAWTENRMDHVTGTSVPFRTENSDFDDLIVGAVFKLGETSNSQWLGQLGFTLPTGDIDQVVTTGPPPPPGSLFPYPMRTGSGHVSIRPSLTYKCWNECHSFGVQALSTIPLHDNDRGYQEGEETQVSMWLSRLLNEKTSASLRVEGYWSDDFDGNDARLNQGLVTTNRPDFQGRSQVSLFGGVNTIVGKHRLAIEVGTPVYQNVQGFQLERDLTMFTSWSRAF